MAGVWENGVLCITIEIPTALVNTAYFYHVTCIMADIAKVLGQKADFLGLGSEYKRKF